MATSWSAAVANAILDAYCRNVAPTLPTQVWIKKHVGSPGAAGTSNPAADTTRKQATFGTAAAAGAIANTAAVTWNAVSTTETYTHWTAWDASVNGNFLFSGTVTNGAVTAGDDFTAAIGALTASLTLAS
jgi:hypothetical protein